MSNKYNSRIKDLKSKKGKKRKQLIRAIRELEKDVIIYHFYQND